MNKPSLDALIQRAKSTITSRLRVSNPAIDALAASIAGVTYGFYGYSDYLFQQLSPETANEEWLYIWASRFETDRVEAQRATGTVNFIGAVASATVPSGLVLKTSDDIEYEVTEATLVAEPVPVRALEAGEESNQPAGIELKMKSAVNGLNPDEITSNLISGGSDIEDIEKWRTRVTLAWKQTQVVGKRSDYEIWALASHPDIGFAHALDNAPSVGLVTVYVGKLETNPIVDQSTKTTTEQYINTQRPAGTHAYIENPEPLPIYIELSGIDVLETRTQVETALDQMIINKMITRASVSPSDIIVEVTSITTEFDLVSPLTTLTPLNNQIITLGGVAWT